MHHHFPSNVIDPGNVTYDTLVAQKQLNLAITEVYVSCLGRSYCLYCESAVVRRGLKREYRFYTILEVLQCGGGSNMA